MQGKTDLLEVIRTLDSRCRFTNLLNGGKQKTNEYGDDSNHDQQFDECEASFPNAMRHDKPWGWTDWSKNDRSAESSTFAIPMPRGIAAVSPLRRQNRFIQQRNNFHWWAEIDHFLLLQTWRAFATEIVDEVRKALVIFLSQ